MRKFKIKKNDEVVVIAGSERGKRGRVLQVLHDKERVIVEGLQIIKRHTRKSQAHPQGAIVQREGEIHISNVVKADVYDSRKSAKPAPAGA